MRGLWFCRLKRAAYELEPGRAQHHLRNEGDGIGLSDHAHHRDVVIKNIFSLGPDSGPFEYLLNIVIRASELADEFISAELWQAEALKSRDFMARSSDHKHLILHERGECEGRILRARQESAVDPASAICFSMSLYDALTNSMQFMKGAEDAGHHLGRVCVAEGGSNRYSCNGRSL